MSDVLTMLPHLDAEQLREVHQRCGALLSIGTPKKILARSDFARDFYEALSEQLFNRTSVRSMPFSVFEKAPAYRDHFLPAAQAAEGANNQWFAGQTHAERISIVRLYAKLVIDHLSAHGRPLVWNVIAYTIAELPAVIDEAFPGYAAAGLLGKVHTMRTSKK